MNDLLVKNFEGEVIYNFIWKNKPCWIALSIAKAIGYKDKSTAITAIIKRENFKLEKEYTILAGESLKEFKNIFDDYLKDFKYSPRIIVLYEEGLYGFLAASRMDKGVAFRTWIRREVMPQIMEKGSYNSNKIEQQINLEDSIKKLELENKNLKKQLYDLKNNLDFDVDKFQRLKVAYETSKLFKSLLDDITLDSKYKFLLLKKIFNDSAFELPMYIEEELN